MSTHPRPLLPLLLLPLALFLGTGATAQVTNQDIPRDNLKGRWINWNVEPVMPVVWEADGSLVYIANQHGSKVAVVVPGSQQIVAEIPVGPGIVSMVMRSSHRELWCVDRATNSVTVIDLDLALITRTIRVGAEPHGLVFSESGDRAYVTCSAVDRVDVIDTATYSVVHSIPIPARSPRAIVRVGHAVYVAPFLSGNGTAPLGAPGSGGAQPAVEVRHTDEFPGLSALPDRDLLTIVTTADPTTDFLDPTRTVAGLGTILKNAHVRPGTTEIWIPHTDALNGEIVGEKNFIEGQIVRNRIAVFDPVQPNDLYFIDLDVLAPATEQRCSPPTGIAFDSTGRYAFVCGYGSNNLAVLDAGNSPPTWVGTIEIDQQRRTPSVGNTPEQDGAGPRVPAMSPTDEFLVVLNSGENSFTRIRMSSVPLDTPGFTYTAPKARLIGWDPIPREIVQGRLDFSRTKNSASQTSSCESCHLGAHTDGLAWDLSGFLDEEGTPRDQLRFPIDRKGPTVTQSTRRLREVGPWHWRGEKKSLMDFDGAFVGLLERISPSTGQLASLGIQFNYTQRYMDTVTLYPNPNAALDRLYTQEQLEGADLFMNLAVHNGLACVDCHPLPLATSGEIVDNTVGGLARTTVVPSLRGVYEKLMSPIHVVGGDFGERTELGVGLGHEGSEPSWFAHLLAAPGGQRRFNLTAAEAFKIVSFLEAFDTGMAPAAGYQVTAHAGNATAVLAGELDFLMDQAARGNCDVIVRAGKGLWAGQPVHFSLLYDPVNDEFRQASRFLPRLTALDLTNLALSGAPITYIGVPVWAGEPLALDRDMDMMFDLDELTFGTNPEDWDTDNDSYPDGYERQLGMDPLATNTSSPDVRAPAILEGPSVVYATQHAIKFEFRADEICKIVVSLNGGMPVLRGPILPFYDSRFSIIVNQLEPATNNTITIDLEDPSGNTNQISFQASTLSPVRSAPVFVEDVSLSYSPGALDAQVQLARAGGQPVASGYVVHGAVYRMGLFGIPQVVTNDVAGTLAGGNGLVNLSVPLGIGLSVRDVGVYYFIVHAIDAPPGEAVYVEADDVEFFDTIPF